MPTGRGARVFAGRGGAGAGRGGAGRGGAGRGGAGAGRGVSKPLKARARGAKKNNRISLRYQRIKK